MNKYLAVGALAIGGALAGLSFAGFGKAQSEDAKTSKAPQTVSGAFSEKEEDDIRSIVEAYIRENPEVLISSLNAYAEKERDTKLQQQAEAREEALSFLISADAGYVTGPSPENAKVAVVEFFDYHCGFCKRANGFVQDLTKDDKDVKVVFRELPILKRESEIAAKYALAARDQGKYVDFHFRLMKATGTLSEDRVLDIAKKTGLDIDALKTAYNDPALERDLVANNTLARDIGAEGTPNFLVASVDGKYIELVTGFRPDDVKAAIEAAKRGERSPAP